MPQFHQFCLVLLITLAFSGVSIAQDESVPKPTARDASPTPQADQDIEGGWERTIKTEAGKFRIVKEHNQHRTRLRVFDSSGKLVQEKTSRYDTETSGSVRIFTFFDSRIVAGKNLGAMDSGEKSYIYRVDGDKFFEVHGMLLTDRVPVSVLVWKRMSDPKSP